MNVPPPFTTAPPDVPAPAAPAHQFTALYRYGEVDTCEGKFERWCDCLMAKTSGPFAAPAMQRENERVKETTPPLWEIRSREEASDFWRAEYAFLYPERGDSGRATATSETDVSASTGNDQDGEGK